MIIVGDSFEKLATLESESVQCCVTSPPYWGLRDYGVDGQIGLEKTPNEYINNLRMIFEQVKRVLKNDGTLWLNLGDTYASVGGCGPQGKHGDRAIRTHTQRNVIGNTVRASGFKSKDLVGIPWQLAFALRDDGWYLRQDIIWHKRNPMPESVRDRCTKSHEYIFLLAKSQKYFFDIDSIKELAVSTRPVGNKARTFDHTPKPGVGAGVPWSPRLGKVTGRGDQGYADARENDRGNSGGYPNLTGMRQKRSVWSVTSKPFKGAHFATFPLDLIEPCVLAGSRPCDTILDPFFGAGTVGLAAKKHGRNYIGIEINPEYAKLAADRIGA